MFYPKAILGGVAGAVKGIFGPVINIARKVKGGILGGVGGLIQTKGALIAAGGSALSDLGKKLAGDGNGGNGGKHVFSFDLMIKTCLV